MVKRHADDLTCPVCLISHDISVVLCFVFCLKTNLPGLSWLLVLSTIKRTKDKDMQVKHKGRTVRNVALTRDKGRIGRIEEAGGARVRPGGKGGVGPGWLGKGDGKSKAHNNDEK